MRKDTIGLAHESEKVTSDQYICADEAKLNRRHADSRTCNNFPTTRKIETSSISYNHEKNNTIKISGQLYLAACGRRCPNLYPRYVLYAS